MNQKSKINENRIFFFDENRENLISNNNIQYKFDYIFSDYENSLLISNSIKYMLTPLILDGNNLLFFSFGHRSLQTNKFMFGTDKATSDNLINKDSFFDYLIQNIISCMNDNKKDLPFDATSIEINKINQEKFIFDVNYYINIYIENNL